MMVINFIWYGIYLRVYRSRDGVTEKRLYRDTD